jgi:two-component system, NarL family, invasion response regulator UvrY
MMPSVLVVDDNQEFRGVVKQLLAEDPNVRVLGEAGDGEEAVELARRVPADVVLMDITMPRLNGIEAARRIKAERPNAKIILVTIHSEEAYQQAAEEIGAEALLTKKDLTGALLPTIRWVVTQEGPTP